MEQAYPASSFHSAVAAEDALRAVVRQGGFKEFRRATETPFNRVFEARR
jgi:hypothetical protein